MYIKVHFDCKCYKKSFGVQPHIETWTYRLVKEIEMKINAIESDQEELYSCWRMVDIWGTKGGLYSENPF